MNLKPIILIDSPTGGPSGTTYDSDVNILPYMTMLKVKPDTQLKHITLILSFKTTAWLSSNLKEHTLYFKDYRIENVDTQTTPKNWIAAGDIGGYIPKLLKLKPSTDYFLLIQGNAFFIVESNDLNSAIARFDKPLYSYIGQKINPQRI